MKARCDLLYCIYLFNQNLFDSVVIVMSEGDLDRKISDFAEENFRWFKFGFSKIIFMHSDHCFMSKKKVCFSFSINIFFQILENVKVKTSHFFAYFVETFSFRKTSFFRRKVVINYIKSRKCWIYFENPEKGNNL